MRRAWVRLAWVLLAWSRRSPEVAGSGLARGKKERRKKEEEEREGEEKKKKKEKESGEGEEREERGEKMEVFRVLSGLIPDYIAFGFMRNFVKTRDLRIVKRNKIKQYTRLRVLHSTLLREILSSKLYLLDIEEIRMIFPHECFSLPCCFFNRTTPP